MALAPLIPTDDPNSPPPGMPLAAQMKLANGPDAPVLPKLSGMSTPVADIAASLGTSGLRPLVTTPMNERMAQLQDQIAKYSTPDHPSGFWHGLGRVLEKTANVAGDILSPPTRGAWIET